MLKKFAQNESGATAIEYALITMLVGVALITGLTLLGTDLNASFTAMAALF